MHETADRCARPDRVGAATRSAATHAPKVRFPALRQGPLLARNGSLGTKWRTTRQSGALLENPGVQIHARGTEERYLVVRL
jgi:hypothetical protein